MFKVLLVMHDHTSGDYYRINKTDFAALPGINQMIYNSDGRVYQVEQVVSFAGYSKNSGIVAVLVVHPVNQDDQANNIYGLDIDDILK